MNEPQYGGLIDWSWIFSWILMPLMFIGVIILTLHFIGSSCPYQEDVSSCFPYNLPDWAKIALPIALLVVPITLLIWMHFMTGERA